MLNIRGNRCNSKRGDCVGYVMCREKQMYKEILKIGLKMLH